MLIIMSLHSILVKSIRDSTQFKANCIILYIPFWLNLYKNPTDVHEYETKTLHSILVKSIPSSFVESSNTSNLYIPFWLNLYKD